ncbi:alpha/beta fold hydrolase [Pedobacter sp. HMF7647]|uniref:Alpha/beta fold hydrolase n=2 Tax=Hufsiella arboris TaxID=2695275 RepID=A0A7K1YE33_9SPHI|nr:alpha/beta fold hydrolase [Hufsiella arboris]
MYSGASAQVASTDTISRKASSEFLTSFDGTKIYYEIAGTGFPVVLLHGFTGTSQGWKSTELYNSLLENGYQVISLDLRGNGKSGKPSSLNGYQHDSEAKDVMLLAKKLALKQYDLIGYSRGSIIAARLLVLDKHVKKAVMGGMGDGFTDPAWPRRVMFYKALSGEPAPELNGFIESINKRGLDRQQLAFQQGAQPSTSPAELSQIKIPVLLVSGDNDPDNGSVDKLAAMIPGSQMRVVPGDHDHAGKTKEFAAAVVDFLK